MAGQFNKRILFYFLTLLFFSTDLISQKGKDGPELVIAPGVIFNRYTPLVQSAVAGNSFIVIGAITDLSGAAIPGIQNNPYSTDGLEACDLLMIIKMQGASMNISNTAGYGSITSYNGVGDYELVEVGSFAGNTLSLANGCILANNYNVSATERVQVVRIPRLTTLNINGGASLVSRPWGQVANTGGVVALETNNVVTINGSVSVNGQGFRGGTAISAFANPAVTNFVGNVSSLGGEKGEGIAGRQTDYDLLNGRYSRGAPANGGGGGNSNNSGGGGGSNSGLLAGYTGFGVPDNFVPAWTTCWNLEAPGFAASSSPGGGRGGYSKSLNDFNALTDAPANALWGGDSRNNIGGLGGKPLNYGANNKLFLGGGGGAGHGDNGTNQDGARGGGIIFITSDANISGTGVITASGDNALPTLPTHIDGPGGGGGGGAIVVLSGNLISGINILASGGVGGNHLSVVNEAEGPGGGGGGGYILTTLTGVTTLATGGNNGTTTSPALSEFIPNGATKGGAGTVVNNTPFNNVTDKVNLGITITGNGAPLCIGGQKTYTVVIDNQACSTASNIIVTLPTPSGVNFTLSNPSPGIYIAPTWTIPSIVAGGSATLTLSGIITASNIGAFAGTVISLSSGECYSANNVTTTPSFTVIQVNITASAVPPVICLGGVSTLTAGGANTYTWIPGNLSGPSPTVSPPATTIYTVTGNISVCFGSQTVQLLVNPTPTLNATAIPSIMCSGQTGTLNAGGAITYTWFPGNLVGASQTVIVFGTTIYTVIGTNIFGCTNSVTAILPVFIPTIVAFPAIICKNGSSTLTAFGANSYTWQPGNINSATIAVSPTASASYTVSGTFSLGCISSTVVFVSVVPDPTVTAVANPTGICPGGVSFLQAFGAASYFWLPPLNVNTYSALASPAATTIYTVIGYNIAGCADTATVQVTVYPVPTVTANALPHAICRGNSSTLTASGANSYTWFPMGTPGATLVVTPSVTTIYTVVGSNTFGCTNSDTTVVYVGPNLSVNASPSVICLGQTSILSASGGTVYLWNPSGLNGSTISVTPTITTNYTLTGTDFIGCPETLTLQVVVNPNPTITAAATPSSICSGENVTLTATGANFYNWTPGNFSGSVVTTFVNSTTIFTVVGTNAFGCSDTKTILVTVNNCTVNVPIGISKKASEPESDGREDFFITFTFIIKNYATFPIYNVQAIDDLTQTFPAPSTFTIISPPISSNNILSTNNGYTGSGNNNLLSNVSNSLAPGQCDTIKFKVKFSGNGIVTFTNSAIATASSLPIGGYGGTDVSDDGNDPDPNSNNNPSDTGEDIPTVFTAITDFFIPQGFSPNGDGVNDVFFIRGIKYYPNNDFTVLNRWGNVVYKKKGYANTWDGKAVEGFKIGGDDLPEGTYYYILDLENGAKPYKGFLYLNRGLTK